jgi:hypothetical protein
MLLNTKIINKTSMHQGETNVLGVNLCCFYEASY